MQFYTVEECYIEHLRSVDDKVRITKGTRPYIGIVLTINNITYLAPLTSYSKDKKEKFDSINDNSLLSLKIYELGNEENRLGMVQLNNMIPVPSSEMCLIDIDQIKKQDAKYAHLLKIQQIYLRKNKDILLKRAKKLYGAVNAQKSGKAAINFIGHLSCDFKSLEAAMTTYAKPQKSTGLSQSKFEALLAKFSH